MTDEERIARITDRDRTLNDFAFRSFRNVGDTDYIAARQACRAQLPVNFLWSSQQTLEKYLKCALFIRRVPAKNLRHSLVPALALLESVRGPLQLTKRTRDFVASIDLVGQYRYMEASIVVEWRKGYTLDQAVWELRRFCTLDPAVTSAQLVEGQVAPRVTITNGYLEKVIANAKHPSRAALLWHNGYFGRRRKTVRVSGGMIAVNSPLLGASEALLDEFAKYAYIPKQILAAYKDHAATDRKRRTKLGQP